MANPSNSPKAVKRKNFIRKTVAIVAVAVLIITGLVLFFRRQVQEKFTGGEADAVLSAQVKTGSIHTTVSGTGSLTGEGIVDVEVPDLVPLDEVVVEAGDSVKAGDVLASVKAGDVLSALSSLQQELDELDEDLKEAKNASVSTKITAGVAGRIKAIYAQPGDDVSTVMYSYGALALMSLDGKMCVTVPAGSYEENQSVTVTDSRGQEYTGTVDSVSGGNARILIPDKDAVYGDTVTVNGADTGTLEIHQELKITGYAGTVSRVNVRENGQVSRNTTLFTLTDTASAVSYDRLLSQRGECEKMYQTLVKLYRDGAVLAPCDGSVVTVPGDDNSADAYSALSAGISSASAGTGTDPLDTTVQFTVDPGKTMSVTMEVDETDILALKEGQAASVTVESIGEETYPGTVTRIDTTAVSADGVTMYTAEITLDRAENMLSGMSAKVSVAIEGVDNALLVPADAVHKTSASAYVYTSYDSETEAYGNPVEVTVGMSDGEYTEITSGLREGDTVYYTKKQENNAFDFFFGNMGGMSGMSGMSGMPGGAGGSGRRK